MKHAQIALLVFAALAGMQFHRDARAEDNPAAYFEDECLDCHHRKKKPLEDKHLTRQEWVKAIDKMIELEKLDPVPSRDYIDKLADWLTANHGPADASAAPSSAAPK